MHKRIKLQSFIELVNGCEISGKPLVTDHGSAYKTNQEGLRIYYFKSGNICVSYHSERFFVSYCQLYFIEDGDTIDPSYPASCPARVRVGYMPQYYFRTFKENVGRKTLYYYASEPTEGQRALFEKFVCIPCECK